MSIYEHLESRTTMQLAMIQNELERKLEGFNREIENKQYLRYVDVSMGMAIRKVDVYKETKEVLENKPERQKKIDRVITLLVHLLKLEQVDKYIKMKPLSSWGKYNEWEDKGYLTEVERYIKKPYV